ncbi:SRPBCC family protein [Mycobacterium sp. NPDC050853]|uniref:SRPBCC family protein n=1 Tax=Mycobacteriaceae TaxID=1762 RepID=UPI0015DEA7B1|nr:SRPBCC family protein [Mycobacteroides sp. LB1]
MRDSVTVHIAAPADKIWELVSDITNTGKFSPETFQAEWLDGATGPAVGVRFRGHVKRNEIGPIYSTVCRVVECDRGRAFGFAVLLPNGKTVNTWRYRFEPVGDATDVSESFELTPTLPLRVYWALLGWARGRRNRRDMLTTLNRIKAVVEAA